MWNIYCEEEIPYAQVLAHSDATRFASETNNMEIKLFLILTNKTARCQNGLYLYKSIFCGF
jgi:hypothetical protein